MDQLSKEWLLAERLNLTRPLISLDIEGSGGDASEARIVQLGIVKLFPPLPLLNEDGRTVSLNLIVNPRRVMSDEVIAVHHITNEYAAKFHPFEEVAEQVFNFITGCDFIGFDLLNYDVPLLWEELYRAGITWDTSETRFIDVANIFKKKEERSLAGALRFYCGKQHQDAHDAIADARATIEVFDAQLTRYPDLMRLTLDDLTTFSHHEKRLDLAGKIVEGPDGRPVYTIRRMRGVAVEDDPSFAEWMLNRDFTVNTKLVLRKILKAIYANDTVDGQESLDPDDGDRMWL